MGDEPLYSQLELFMQQEHRSRFRLLYEYCEERKDFLYDFFNKCPIFVDHGWRHVKNVLSILDALLLPRFIEDPNYLNSSEIFYLLSAVLLHDIGLGYRGEFTKEDEETTKDILDKCLKVRKIHGRLSARMIEEMGEFRSILGDDASIVAKIVKYHQSKAPLTREHMERLGEKSLEKTWIEKETIDSTGTKIITRLLAAYLRLADAIDINQRRVSPYEKYLELEKVLENEVEKLCEEIGKKLTILHKLGKINQNELTNLQEKLSRITDRRLTEKEFETLKKEIETRITTYKDQIKDEAFNILQQEILKLLKKLELLKYQYKHYRKHKSFVVASRLHIHKAFLYIG